MHAKYFSRYESNLQWITLHTFQLFICYFNYTCGYQLYLIFSCVHSWYSMFHYDFNNVMPINCFHWFRYQLASSSPQRVSDPVPCVYLNCNPQNSMCSFWLEQVPPSLASFTNGMSCSKWQQVLMCWSWFIQWACFPSIITMTESPWSLQAAF